MSNDVTYTCGRCCTAMQVAREDRYQLHVCCGGCGLSRMIDDPDAPPRPKSTRLADLAPNELTEHVRRADQETSRAQFGANGRKTRFY